MTVDTAFDAVLSACRERPSWTWITDAAADAYTRLNRLGWAHSVEVWSCETSELVGGIFGVGVGAYFSGESMFHRKSSASTLAFVSLVRWLTQADFALLDVHVMSNHLASLGCIEVSRADYLSTLANAVGAVRELPALPPG